jgi:hypothetical protein
MNIYQQAGYENRTAYLEELSVEYDIELDYVIMLSDFGGEDEDFDGLVTTLSDLADERDYE